jgi:hypothetical protein
MAEKGWKSKGDKEPRRKSPRKTGKTCWHSKKKKKELSAIVLPMPGEKTVASEAFGEKNKKNWWLNASTRRQRRCSAFLPVPLSIVNKLIYISVSG